MNLYLKIVLTLRFNQISEQIGSLKIILIVPVVAFVVCNQIVSNAKSAISMSTGIVPVIWKKKIYAKEIQLFNSFGNKFPIEKTRDFVFETTIYEIQLENSTTTLIWKRYIYSGGTLFFDIITVIAIVIRQLIYKNGDKWFSKYFRNILSWSKNPDTDFLTDFVEFSKKRTNWTSS